MRLLAVALVFTFAVAVTASVFAIWPAVADAPWEDATPTPPRPAQTNEIRCQEALDLRERYLFENPYREAEAWTAAMENALEEIDRYC